MKISDLFENKKEEYDEQLKRDIMDLLVLYNVTGVGKTNILNLVSELDKEGLSVDVETLKEIIREIGFEVDDDNVLFDDKPSEEFLDDGEEFDPVGSMADTATQKRMK